jgi:hypothetical protein
MANEKKFEVAGNVSIAHSGKTTVMEKEEFEKAVDTVSAGAGQSLTEMYDRYSRLLYVIDASGSMGDGLLSEDTIRQFKWTPEILEAFRKQMDKDGYFTKMAAKKSVADIDEEDEFDEDDEEDFEEEEPEFTSAYDLSDDQLKWEIVSNNLQYEYDVNLPTDYQFRRKGRSKMMAVKDAAKGFVGERFKKFSDAKVGVFKFEDNPELMVSPGASEQEVINAINRLPDGGGGGTNIYRAVDRAVNELQKRGSELKLNHIVLVSDGADHGAINIKNLVPNMKANGIVFDFIYIKGPGQDPTAEAVGEVLKGVCEATGGEYTVVTTEKDFEVKFLAVSNRPLLPPARS